MSRAVIYARYSSAKQNDESIEQQVSKAQKYAAQKGHTIINQYCDRAISGRSDDRAEFQKMLKDAKSHKFDVVITWKMDRLGRDRYSLIDAKRSLKKSGVTVEYVAENIPEGNEGVLFESLLEGMAEYYSRQLSTNVKRGMLFNAQQGKSNGHFPLGYKPNPETKQLEIDPETAPIVQRIFREYASGKRATDIIDDLNRDGIKTGMGRQFTRSSLHRMLINKKYIGIYEYKVGTPDEVIIDDVIPPIVDTEVFQKCQSTVKFYAKGKRTEMSKEMYILSGKLFCGHCLESMQGMSGKGRNGKINYYYRCFGRAKHKCDKKIVKAEYIEDLVVNTIRELLQDEDLIDAIADKMVEYWTRETASERKQLPQLKKELGGIDKKINRLIQLTAETDMPIQEISEQIQNYKNRKEYLIKEVSELESSTELFSKAEIVGYFKCLSSLGTDSPAERKALINAFIQRIYLYDDKMLIHFNYTDGEPNEYPVPSELEADERIVTANQKVTILTTYNPITLTIVVEF